MIENEDINLDEETELLQKSIHSLIETNREFIRIIMIFTNRSDFKSKRIAMEVKAAFDIFVQAQADLQVLRVYRGDQDN